MDWITKLLDIGKIPAKIILWIFLLSAALLLMPHAWATSLQLDEFLKEEGKFVGISFLGSAILLLIQGTLWFRLRAQQSKKKSQVEESVSKKLKQLDTFEVAVLREFYLQGKNTIVLPIDDATVAGLLESHVLRVISGNGEMSMVGMLYPVALSSTAQKLVTPRLLDLPVGNLTEAQMDAIARSRPKFVAAIARRDWLRS